MRLGFDLALVLLAAAPLACGDSVSTTSPGAGGSGAGSSATGAAGSPASSGATGGAGAGTSSASTTGSSTSTNASSSASTSASTGTGGGCDNCASPFTCCNGVCAYTDNDVHNCGGCGIQCPGAKPYCHLGMCATPPCEVTGCGAGQACCGSTCCGDGQLCCDIPGGPVVQNQPQCAMPTEHGTCPVGCLECVCTSPDTPIATPSGDRAIAELHAGDLVYSLHHGAIVAVPILSTNRVPAHDHHVVRVKLMNGTVLEISPRHPTADGRTFADLRVGDRMDGAMIVERETIPYTHEYTYDILPDSETGTYVAGGVLIGSTLHQRP